MYIAPPLCSREEKNWFSTPIICIIATGNVNTELANIGGMTPEILIFKGKKEWSWLPEDLNMAEFGYCILIFLWVFSKKQTNITAKTKNTK